MKYTNKNKKGKKLKFYTHKNKKMYGGACNLVSIKTFTVLKVCDTIHDFFDFKHPFFDFEDKIMTNIIRYIIAYNSLLYLKKPVEPIPKFNIAKHNGTCTKPMTNCIKNFFETLKECSLSVSKIEDTGMKFFDYPKKMGAHQIKYIESDTPQQQSEKFYDLCSLVSGLPKTIVKTKRIKFIGDAGFGSIDKLAVKHHDYMIDPSTPIAIKNMYLRPKFIITQCTVADSATTVGYSELVARDLIDYEFIYEDATNADFISQGLLYTSSINRLKYKSSGTFTSVNPNFTYNIIDKATESTIHSIKYGTGGSNNYNQGPSKELLASLVLYRFNKENSTLLNNIPAIKDRIDTILTAQILPTDATLVAYNSSIKSYAANIKIEEAKTPKNSIVIKNYNTLKDKADYNKKLYTHRGFPDKKGVVDLVNDTNFKFNTVNYLTLLDMKRCGDYDQVISAIKLSKINTATDLVIFCTLDKLCALYAHKKNLPVVRFLGSDLFIMPVPPPTLPPIQDGGNYFECNNKHKMKGGGINEMFEDTDEDYERTVILSQFELSRYYTDKNSMLQYNMGSYCCQKITESFPLYNHYYNVLYKYSSSLDYNDKSYIIYDDLSIRVMHNISDDVLILTANHITCLNFCIILSNELIMQKNPDGIIETLRRHYESITNIDSTHIFKTLSKLYSDMCIEGGYIDVLYKYINKTAYTLEYFNEIFKETFIYNILFYKTLDETSKSIKLYEAYMMHNRNDIEGYIQLFLDFFSMNNITRNLIYEYFIDGCINITFYNTSYANIYMNLSIFKKYFEKEEHHLMYIYNLYLEQFKMKIIKWLEEISGILYKNINILYNLLYEMIDIQYRLYVKYSDDDNRYNDIYIRILSYIELYSELAIKRNSLFKKQFRDKINQSTNLDYCFSLLDEYFNNNDKIKDQTYERIDKYLYIVHLYRNNLIKEIYSSLLKIFKDNYQIPLLYRYIDIEDNNPTTIEYHNILFNLQYYLIYIQYPHIPCSDECILLINTIEPNDEDSHNGLLIKILKEYKKYRENIEIRKLEGVITDEILYIREMPTNGIYQTLQKHETELYIIDDESSSIIESDNTLINHMNETIVNIGIYEDKSNKELTFKMIREYLIIQLTLCSNENVKAFITSELSNHRTITYVNIDNSIDSYQFTIKTFYPEHKFERTDSIHNDVNNIITLVNENWQHLNYIKYQKYIESICIIFNILIDAYLYKVIYSYNNFDKYCESSTFLAVLFIKCMVHTEHFNSIYHSVFNNDYELEDSKNVRFNYICDSYESYNNNNLSQMIKYFSGMVNKLTDNRQIFIYTTQILGHIHDPAFSIMTFSIMTLSGGKNKLNKNINPKQTFINKNLKKTGKSVKTIKIEKNRKSKQTHKHKNRPRKTRKHRST